MSLSALIAGGCLVVLVMIISRSWLDSHRRFTREHFRYFDDSPDLLCTAGFDGYFLNVNASFLRVLGYTHKEMLAQPFMFFVHEADKETTIEASLKLSAGEGLTEFENRYLCKDGSWKWLMWNSKADRFDGIIFASAKDITQRKALEETLKISQSALMKALAVEKSMLKALQDKAEDLSRSNQELASFAHVVAHDLQEPLRTITSYCQMLEEKNKAILSAETIEIMAFITDASRRMKEMIRDLLVYGKVDHSTVKFVPVSLMEVMEDVSAVLKGSIGESRTQITYDSLPDVFADRLYMVQLFQNIIGNAIKYRGEHAPIIHISSSQDDEKVVISVRDNGIGIAPRHHERIFGMFKRLHTRDKYEGTGIGLALCKKITDILNGSIRVESEVGQGATFHVTLLPVPQAQMTLSA